MSDSPVQRRNSRLGLLLFSIYLTFYLVFILLCAFAPGVMEWRPLESLNLAILYGFSLILAAFLSAFLYGLLCRRDGTEQ